MGGKSRRMGTEKAELVFEGKTLKTRLIDILSKHLDEIYLSVSHDETRSFDLPVIQDLTANPGPLGALQAAFHRDPDTTWLVVACDLPLFDEETLTYLLNQSDPSAKATCFLSRMDHRAEPLCALYRPAALPSLTETLAADRRCARRFLEDLSPQTLKLPQPLALDNANRPEQLEEIKLLSQKGLIEKTVHITYFGKLTAEAPSENETRLTSAATAAGLYEELRMTHRLSLDIDSVKPVLQDEIVPWNTEIPEGSQLAFLPPFAGG